MADTVTLHDITLLHVPASAGRPAQLALEMSGDRDGVTLLVGAGSAPDLERLLEDDPLDRSLRQSALGPSGGMWFGTGLDATIVGGIPDRAVWFAVVRDDRIDVLGIEPVQPTLGVPGVLDVDGRCVLRTRLSMRAGSVTRAECVLAGRLRFAAHLGPVRVAGAAATFRLSAATASLDRAWSGTLFCEVDTSAGLRVFGADVSAPQSLRLTARCHAGAAASTFSIDAVDYEHALSEVRVANGAVRLDDLRLSAHLHGWDASGFASFQAAGSGRVTLPAAFGPATAGSPPRLDASLTFRSVREGTHYRTGVDGQLGGLHLTPAVNPLGISAGMVRLTIDGADVRLESSFRQSWTAVATRLRDAGVVQLPEATGLPDLQCAFRIERASSSVRVALMLEVLTTGQMWVLPLAVEDWRIHLVATLASNTWGWQGEGAGLLTSLAPLAAIVPLARAACTFALAAVDGQPPELRVSIAGNLPALALPPFQRGGAPLRVLEPVAITMSLSAALTARVQVRLLRGLAGLAAAADLPADWDQFLWPLVSAVSGATGVLTVTMPATGTGDTRLALTFDAPLDAVPFDPLRAFARILPAPPPAAAASHPSPPLLTITPRRLSFSASLPPTGEPVIELQAGVSCAVLGETFDAWVGFAVREGAPEVVIRAAHHDPILIGIPSPGNGALLATLDADLARVLAMYRITAGQARQQMQDVRQQLATIFGDTSHDTLMAFEIVDLTIAFRPGAAIDPVTVSGGVRLAQSPPVLDALLGGPAPTLTLGTSGTSVFVEVSPVGVQPEPLVSVPVGDRGHVEVFLHNLRIGYRWDPPAVEFALASTIDSPSLPFHGGVGLLLPPRSTIDAAIAAPAPPPFPIPQWRADFIGQNRQPSNRGIELVFGQSLQNRALTVYLRETVFSPTFYFLMPGGRIDGGAYLGARPQDRGPAVFHCEFRLGGGQWITMSPVMGLLLNPLAALPPFVTANPPFWVIPGLMMGDFFTDASGATGLELSVNLPLLAGFEVVFKRPLPSITLQMLLEIAALAAQGFSVEIPSNSSLTPLFYAELTGTVTLHALATLFGTSQGPLTASLRFNIVDLMNGALQLMQSGREVLEAGASAAQKAMEFAAASAANPELIIKMIPRQQRGFHADTALSVPGFEFACHLSAYLLLPDELEAELRAYHENRRRKGRGLAALRESLVDGGAAAAPFEWDAFDRFNRKVLTNVSAWTGDTLRARIAGQASARLAASTAAPVATLTQQLTARALAEIVPALLAARTAQTRLNVLRQWDLDTLGPQVERLVAMPRVRADQVRALIDDGLRATAAVSVEVRAIAPGSSMQVADRLLAASFEIGSDGTIRARGARRRPVREVGRTKLLGARLERASDRAVAERTPRRALSPRELAIWRSETTRFLASEIDAASLVGSRTKVPMQRLDDVARDLASAAFDLDSLPRAEFGTIPTRVNVFRGRALNERLGRFLDLRGRVPPPIAPEGRVEVRDGYVIRARPDVRQHAPDFAVPAPARHARFQVRLRGGDYRVEVPGRPPVTVPDALVNRLPPTPDRARRLRHLLVIEEARSTRPLTASERASLDSDPYVEIPGLYQSTLFARPEYRIKPTGGVRGPTSLADILRRPNGDYDVPAGPCVLTGALVQLRMGGLTFQVQFCGYVSPGASAPSRVPMMLLFAHSEQNIPFGPFSCRLKGDFHLLAGRDSFTVGGDTLAQGIGFNGSATLFHGSHEILSGAATTKAAVKAGSRLQLTLALALRLDIAFDDLAIAGVELAKGWITQDLELQIVLGAHLQASLSADIDFRYQTKTITWRDEEHWVCGSLGPLRHCEKITVPEPHLEWGPVQRADATLDIEVDSSTATVRVRVSVPSLGLSDLPIPDFFSAIA